MKYKGFIYEKKLQKTLEMKLKGKSLSDIAKELGVTRRTAANYWRFVREHPEKFSIENFDVIRREIWRRLFILLDDQELGKSHKIRAVVDCLRSIEPIHQKLEVEQKPSKIEVSWARKDEE